MSPEAQRIAIAEACGWVRKDESYPYPASSDGICKRIVWYTPDGVAQPLGDAAIPDYLNDLNAMHEAVDSVLVEAGRNGDWRGWDSYVLTLSEMVGSEGAIEATAAQRAEPFLKVIGKWKD